MAIHGHELNGISAEPLSPSIPYVQKPAVNRVLLQEIRKFIQYQT